MIIKLTKTNNQRFQKNIGQFFGCTSIEACKPAILWACYPNGEVKEDSETLRTSSVTGFRILQDTCTIETANSVYIFDIIKPM